MNIDMQKVEAFLTGYGTLETYKDIHPGRKFRSIKSRNYPEVVKIVTG